MNPRAVLAMFGSVAFGVVAGVAVDVGVDGETVVAPKPDAELPAGLVHVELNDNHDGADPCTGVIAYKGDDGVTRSAPYELPCAAFDNFGEGMTRLIMSRGRDGLCRGQVGGPGKGSFALTTSCDALTEALKDATLTTPLEPHP